jgi:hypothetical protein
MRLVGTYPVRSDYAFDGNAPNYPRLRRAAGGLVDSRAIDDILAATFGRLLVDEYQDCSRGQHALVMSLTRLLPACVFGDSLQAVFNFDSNDRLPAWNEVVAEFNLIGELDVPHRWKNVQANDLGEWLLRARAALLRGEQIDLRTGGARVRWRRLTGVQADDMRAQVNAQYEIDRNRNETVLIIGDSRNAGSRHE